MNQTLDPEEWPSIRFEGELMPQSLSAIHILINRDFTERTGDWIWRLPHCKEVWKDGEATWCIESATEIIDHLLENRAEIIAEIQDRLGPHEFDAETTIDEWLTALARIQTLTRSRSAGDTCRWIAGEPTERAEETRRRILAFLDNQQPPES
jgi:hypothetical protein